MATLPFSSHAHTSQTWSHFTASAVGCLLYAYGHLLSEKKTQKLLGARGRDEVSQAGRTAHQQTHLSLQEATSSLLIPMPSSQNITQGWRIFQFSNKSYDAVFLCETSWFLKSGE